MTSPEPCDFLQWDTDFFGVRVGKVRDSTLTPEKVESILQWSEKQAIDCLYFLADSDSAETVQLAEDHGFRLVDIRVTLDVQVDNPKPPENTDSLRFRLSVQGDLQALQTTARNAYTQSRFYYDPCFPPEKCAELYNRWLARSIGDGYADGVIISELAGHAVGYVTCRLDRERQTGEIGLVGVTEAARGQQIGRRMLDYALHWFAKQGMQRVSVVTQGRNIGAQRLYQHAGFRTRSVQLWYHKWFNDCTLQR